MSISPLATAALRVINAAWQNGTSYDLASQAAFALDSAQLLQSPETAAEQVALRADRDGFREQRNAVFKTNEELLIRVERAELERLQVQNENRTLTRRVAELEAAASSTRTADEDPIAYALTVKADPAREQSVVKLRALLAGQSEDPHDGPLHHAYRIGHDLEATS